MSIHGIILDLITQGFNIYWGIGLTVLVVFSIPLIVDWNSRIQFMVRGSLIMTVCGQFETVSCAKTLEKEHTRVHTYIHTYISPCRTSGALHFALFFLDVLVLWSILQNLDCSQVCFNPCHFNPHHHFTSFICPCWGETTRTSKRFSSEINYKDHILVFSLCPHRLLISLTIGYHTTKVQVL